MKRYRIVRKHAKSWHGKDFTNLIYKIQARYFFFWFTIESFSYNVRITSSFDHYDTIVQERLDAIREEKTIKLKTVILIDTGKVKESNKKSDKIGALSFPKKGK